MNNERVASQETDLDVDFLEDIYKTLLRDPAYHDFMLPGTGFSTLEQMRMWTKGFYRFLDEGVDFDKAKSVIFQKNILDMVSFDVEYLDDRVAWPIYASFGQCEGEERVVSHKYGGGPILTNTSKSERDGSFWESYRELEKGLIERRNKNMGGALGIIISPEGWSGYEQDYPDTQIYVYKINNNLDLEAITIRTGLNLEECERLVYALEGRKLDQQKTNVGRIKEVVGAPIFLGEKGCTFDFPDVVDAIKGVSGDDKVWGDYDFSDLYEIVGSHEKLSYVSGITEGRMREYREFLEQNFTDYESVFSVEGIAAMAVETGRAILDIAPSSPVGEPDGYSSRLETVQSKRGCNGGGERGLNARLRHPDWVWKEHQICVKCGGQDVTVGPCGVCESCQDKFDTGLLQ